MYDSSMLSPDINRLVKANDNFFFSWLKGKDGPERERYAKHIPLASGLIASRHCAQWWKNHPESVEYQYAHHAICCQLAHPCPARESTLRFIALFLECNPLALTSDFSIDLSGVR